MKNRLNILLTFLTFTFFFTSCSNYYYSPNDGDLVTLRKQHDGHVSGSSNLGEREDKQLMNLQVGYSPINHLAFSGSYFKTSDQGNNDKRYGNGYILNGSIGGYYFFPIEENLIFTKKRKRTSKNSNLNMEKGILMDLYVGTGEGKVNNFYTEGGSSQFKFRKNYVQMGFHYIKKNWGLSYNVRRGRLNYSNGIIYNRLKIDASDLAKFEDLTINNSFDLVEHSLRLNVSIKHVRYFFNITSVIETVELRDLGVENDNLTVGFILEIDEFFRKVIKKEKELEIDF
ncbi:MAG: hypothetical protein AB8H03_18965 [Saprospiraceae bacterium]